MGFTSYFAGPGRARNAGRYAQFALKFFEKLSKKVLT
jgi:hypothetical protein